MVLVLLVVIAMLAAAILFLLQAAKNKADPQSQLTADEAVMEDWADTIAAKVGIKLKLGQAVNPPVPLNSTPTMTVDTVVKTATPPSSNGHTS